MEAPTAQLKALSGLANRDPYALLADTASESAQSDQDWRALIRAEAFDIVSRPTDAQRIATAVLAKTPNPTSPLYVEAIYRLAMNGFRPDEATRLIPVATAAYRTQTPASAGRVCLQIALGEMNRIRARPDLGVVALMQAYREGAKYGFDLPRLAAAEKLARVLNWAGDTDEALSLLAEVAKWDFGHGWRYSLSNDLYFRGEYKMRQGRYTAALDDFALSRRYSSDHLDVSGTAFIDLQSCRALIELHRLVTAETLCSAAEKAFQSLDDAALYQARFQLARIAAERGL